MYKSDLNFYPRGEDKKDTNLRLRELISTHRYQELTKISQREGISLRWAVDIAINEFINAYKDKNINIPDPSV